MSTDIESVIAAIREASAKTMQDKWVAWFQAEQSEVCRVHTQGATVACSVLEADAAHIAACSPANMAVVLAHIDNLTSERDEARAEVSYFKELAEKRNDRICELLEDSIARRAAISAPAPTETGIPASERNQQVAAEAPITDADINAHLARLYAAKGREMPESERVSRASAPQAAEPRGCPIPGACAGVPAIAAAVEAMRQRAEKAERELAIIKAMAATGTAQSFLSTDDETKRFVFALATEESRRRKIAETALLPFAKAAEQVDKRIADHARLGMGAKSGETSIGLGIKFKHILAARAALDGPATEGEGK